MVSLLIVLIVILIVFALVWAAMRYVPMPEPLNWVIPAVMLLVLAVILLATLLPMAGVHLP